MEQTLGSHREIYNIVLLMAPVRFKDVYYTKIKKLAYPQVVPSSYNLISSKDVLRNVRSSYLFSGSLKGKKENVVHM